MVRYDAREGYVFDFRKPCYIGEDANGNLIKQRLYSKTIFLDEDDSIDNYIEVEIDCIEPEATENDYILALMELGAV